MCKHGGFLAFTRSMTFFHTYKHAHFERWALFATLEGSVIWTVLTESQLKENLKEPEGLCDSAAHIPSQCEA